MRVKNSMKNITISLVTNILIIVIGFVAQEVFIRELNDEYLGINGLFKNIISMLSVAELGIGSAIVYHLYKPLANGDNKIILALMKFYKKCYSIIACVVLVLSLLIIPFLKYIVGDINISDNLYIIYFLFVFDSIITYMLSYKRSILYANQKNYYINIVHICCFLILNILQISVLVLFNNYYLYLMLKIIFSIIENLIISIYVNKKYAFIKTMKSEKLNKEIVNDIIKKIKALFFHKIGTFIVLGSDNIIISMLLGITQVGLYSNYYLIISGVSSLIGQLFSSLTASVGNLIVTEKPEKCYKVYKRIELFNFWIICFTAVCLLILIEPFIKIWIGGRYILSTLVLITLIINYYFQMLRYRTNIFKEAAGIFHEDRFIPLIESTVNIVVSIILLQFFGLAGVFMGTIISNFILIFYSHPKFVYKKLFNKSYKEYFIDTIKYFVIFIIISIITMFICSKIIINNIILLFIIELLICLIIPNIILILIFKNNDEFNYYLNIFRDKFAKNK